MKILAIVGMAGSGKSVLSGYLRAKGFPVLRLGEFVMEEVERRGLPITPENERFVREDLRRQHGMDVCAQLALPVIRAAQAELFVIDGLYSFSEYKTFRREFGDRLVVVAVFTSRPLRYQRLAVRVERPLTAEEAQRRDEVEIERIEKGGPIALADYTLLNDGAPDDLTRQAEALLKLL